MTPLRVYIGFDRREQAAYDVAVKSLLHHASIPVSITPLDIVRLESSGLLRRPTDTRGHRYDILSNANAATEFAISRFLVPLLAQSGPALFVDCDVVFMADVAELLDYVDPRFAVSCVQHDHRPSGSMKMDNQPQVGYPRKNWSSVMLWNCDHPANRRLSLADVQVRRGLDLHQLYWLNDSEIGELPPQWNWLVGEQIMPRTPKIAHFTLGGPFTPGWPGAEYDRIWYEARDRA